MFAVQEMGLRAIAETLTTEGIPSPSAYDPTRNRHRNPIGWSHSAVRAILTNPTYRGVRVWGKQEKYETLIDPDDVAAGHQTRMRWRDVDTWITPAGRTHEPLVSDELAALVAGQIATRTPGRPKPRVSRHPYSLRGMISALGVARSSKAPTDPPKETVTAGCSTGARYDEDALCQRT